MQRIDGANVSGVLPAPAATNAPGYFTQGDPGLGVLPTQITGDWLNMVQEELRAVAVLRGAAPSKTNNGQCAAALGPTLLLDGNASGAAGAKTTPWQNGILAGGGFTGEAFTANAGPAAHIAGDGNVADGLFAASLAGDGCTVGAAGKNNAAAVAALDSQAIGERSAVIASDKVDATGHCSAVIASGRTNSAQVASGAGAVVMASTDSSGGSTDPCTVAGDNAAVIASDRCDVGAGGDVSAVLASYRSSTQAGHSAVIASALASTGGSESAVIASTPDGPGVISETSGQVGAVIASMGGKAQSTAGKALVGACEDSIASGESSVVLASEGVEVGTNYAVGGGRTAAALGATTGADRNLTWRIESISGDIYSDGVVGAGAADYAEAFENVTPGSALPVGSLVARTGRKVRLATTGDEILGVVSANPAICGNSAPLDWQGRYQRDAFGKFLTESVAFVRWPATFEQRARVPAAESYSILYRDDAGALHEMTLTAWLALPVDARPLGRVTLSTVPVVGSSPMFDGPLANLPAFAATFPGVVVYKEQTRAGYSGPRSSAPSPIPSDAVSFTVEQRVETGTATNQAYTPRHKRPLEWTVVGFLGQLAVKVDATVAADDDVVPGSTAGLGTKAANATVARAARALKCLEIQSAFQSGRGYAVALCLVR